MDGLIQFLESTILFSNVLCIGYLEKILEAEIVFVNQNFKSMLNFHKWSLRWEDEELSSHLHLIPWSLDQIWCQMRILFSYSMVKNLFERGFDCLLNWGFLFLLVKILIRRKLKINLFKKKFAGWLFL